jgi:hypothetical protein
MRLTIFLDIDEVFRFSQLLPVKSSTSAAIGRAIRSREYWGSVGRDVVVECDDSEGRDLLGYAESNCPSAMDKIQRAFRLAHLRTHDDHHSSPTAFAKASATGKSADRK